jgi:hypothetical protein
VNNPPLELVKWLWLLLIILIGVDNFNLPIGTQFPIPQQILMLSKNAVILFLVATKT